MINYTANDFVCIKELPICASVFFADIQYNMNNENLFELIYNSLKITHLVVHINKCSYYHTICITWAYDSSEDKIRIWASASDHNDSINFDEYFTICNSSKKRGAYHNEKFNL